MLKRWYGMEYREIKDNLFDLYASYHQHKLLFEFWKQYKNVKGEKDIRDRIEYIKKNKLKQRNEVETLLWVLGETNVDD